MLIAYVSTDDVNQYLATQMAQACGETRCRLTLTDAPPDGGFDAAIYDWDSLPVQQQRDVLAELRTGRAPAQLAVHSDHLEDDCIEGLRRLGIAVYRALQPEVFRNLTRAENPLTDNGNANQEKRQHNEGLALAAD